MLALTRYIHRNPVKAGLTKTAGEYQWSSYRCYVEDTYDFDRVLDNDMILGMFSTDQKKANMLYEKFMNEKAEDNFIEIQEENQVMGEEEAKLLFEQMLGEGGSREQIIKEFKQKSNLPLRQIADITGINKDKVSRILKES